MLSVDIQSSLQDSCYCLLTQYPEMNHWANIISSYGTRNHQRFSLNHRHSAADLFINMLAVFKKGGFWSMEITTVKVITAMNHN